MEHRRLRIPAKTMGACVAALFAGSSPCYSFADRYTVRKRTPARRRPRNKQLSSGRESTCAQPEDVWMSSSRSPLSGIGWVEEGLCSMGGLPVERTKRAHLSL